MNKKDIYIRNYHCFYYLNKHTASGLSQDVLFTAKTVSHGQLFFVNFLDVNVFNEFNLFKLFFYLIYFLMIKDLKYLQKEATVLISVTLI
jgi:hypothetical protein